KRSWVSQRAKCPMVARYAPAIVPEYPWRCRYPTYEAALGLSTLAESHVRQREVVDMDAPPGNDDMPSPTEHLRLCVQLGDHVSGAGAVYRPCTPTASATVPIIRQRS